MLIHSILHSTWIHVWKAKLQGQQLIIKHVFNKVNLDKYYKFLKLERVHTNVVLVHPFLYAKPILVSKVPSNCCTN